MRKIFLLLAAAAGLRAAAVEPLTTDTVSEAFATAWGANILPALHRDYPSEEQRNLFVEGMREAFTTDADREPYYQGMLQGLTVMSRLGQMRELGFPIDEKTFAAILTKVLGDGKTSFTPEEADRYLNAFMARKYEEQMAADTLTRASQEKFLGEIAGIPGVEKTASGLLFQTIEEGEGESPLPADDVALVYVGQFYNGTVFDEAEDPVVFPVNGLVPGFTEGLTMMKPGGKYRIVIPADLGYGAKGLAGAIPGNAALDFTIRLLRVIKK